MAMTSATAPVNVRAPGEGDAGCPRDLTQVLFHGASPGRWKRRGADTAEPAFAGGCFMTPDAELASMYAADWTAREDRLAFIASIVNEVFQLSDPEELLAHGFIEGDEDVGYRRSNAASAEYVLQHWSQFDISHHLVRRSIRSVHSYPEAAVVYPFTLMTEDMAFYDCAGRHFDDLDGRTFGMDRACVCTDEVVDSLRGTTRAIWFMNLTDPVHSTALNIHDTVYVYDPRDLVFALSGRPVLGETCQVGPIM